VPRLQVLNGKRQGEVFEIPPGAELVVGHRQSASISIDDPWVSWDHARLVYRPDSADCWIEDLGSTNGTYVNCVRVKREQLRHEDIIFLGKTHVIFLSPIADDDPFFGGGAESTGKHTAVGFPAALTGGGLAGSSPLSAPSSEIGLPFPSQDSRSGTANGVPALGPGSKDPFASTGTRHPAPLWMPSGKGKDPFSASASSVDPFSSGPDYSGLGSEERAPAFGKPNSPFAETLGDDQVQAYSDPSVPAKPSLSLSGLEGDDVRMDLPGPSSNEIARLIEGGGLGSSDMLGELAGLQSPMGNASRGTVKLPKADSDLFARTSDPAPSPFDLDSPKRSEMRTQAISTDAVNDLIEQQRRPQTEPSGPSAQRTPRSTPGEIGALAFDKARLEDEVGRLRMALQAAKERDPHAVQAAAQALRDAELGRLAQRVASLERDLATSRAEVSAREEELNEVTDEMIEKEDLIDTLRDQLATQALPSRARATGAPPPPPPPPAGGDWASLEF
jgi:hypothetical protein